VLAGVDAASTYCYLLAAEHHRDADTWGVHLLDATEQGLKPDFTITDAGQGLRAGQKAAWGDTPCHGDVFHIQRQCEGLANMLSRLAKGATSRRQMLQAKTGRAGLGGPDDELATQLVLARQTETQAHELARDIRTLTQWLHHDVLTLAGPALTTRQMLFDFVVEELARREPEDARRIRPVRIALQNQRDTVLAFAGVLDQKLADIAQTHAISEPLVREACLLHRLPSTSPAYWQGWNRLRAQTGGKFHTLFDAVSHAMARTPRSGSLVENHLHLRSRPAQMPAAFRWPGHDDAFALVLPEARAVTMDLFLARFAETLPAGVHAVLMLDQAGWHGRAALQVPENVTLLPLPQTLCVSALPPYWPELNPVERVWLYLRERFLSFRLYQGEGAIVDALCAAWNALCVRQAKLARSSRWKTGAGKG